MWEEDRPYPLGGRNHSRVRTQYNLGWCVNQFHSACHRFGNPPGRWFLLQEVSESWYPRTQQQVPESSLATVPIYYDKGSDGRLKHPSRRHRFLQCENLAIPHASRHPWKKYENHFHSSSYRELWMGCGGGTGWMRWLLYASKYMWEKAKLH